MSYGDFMGNNAVSDTGPIIHLSEINLLNALKIFHNVYIPSEVKKELIKNKIKIPSFLRSLKLNGKFKEVSAILTNKFSLDLGESQAIALALQEKINYFLTDDLEAREIAKTYNLEARGTVGIISRSFRDKIIDKKTAIEKIKELHIKSSLFITKELVSEIIKTILDFKR